MIDNFDELVENAPKLPQDVLQSLNKQFEEDETNHPSYAPPMLYIINIDKEMYNYNKELFISLFKECFYNGQEKIILDVIEKVGHFKVVRDFLYASRNEKYIAKMLNIPIDTYLMLTNKKPYVEEDIFELMEQKNLNADVQVLIVKTRVKKFILKLLERNDIAIEAMKMITVFGSVELLLALLNKACYMHELCESVQRRLVASGNSEAIAIMLDNFSYFPLALDVQGDILSLNNKELELKLILRNDFSPTLQVTLAKIGIKNDIKALLKKDFLDFKAQGVIFENAITKDFAKELKENQGIDWIVKSKEPFEDKKIIEKLLKRNDLHWSIQDAIAITRQDEYLAKLLDMKFLHWNTQKIIARTNNDEYVVKLINRDDIFMETLVDIVKFCKPKYVRHILTLKKDENNKRVQNEIVRKYGKSNQAFIKTLLSRPSLSDDTLAKIVELHSDDFIQKILTRETLGPLTMYEIAKIGNQMFNDYLLQRENLDDKSLETIVKVCTDKQMELILKRSLLSKNVQMFIVKHADANSILEILKRDDLCIEVQEELSENINYVQYIISRKDVSDAILSKIINKGNDFLILQIIRKEYLSSAIQLEIAYTGKNEYILPLLEKKSLCFDAQEFIAGLNIEVFSSKLLELNYLCCSAQRNIANFAVNSNNKTMLFKLLLLNKLEAETQIIIARSSVIDVIYSLIQREDMCWKAQLALIESSNHHLFIPLLLKKKTLSYNAMYKISKLRYKKYNKILNEKFGYPC